MRASSKRNLFGILIPLATVTFGFGASLTLSLLEGTFWMNSKYDVPLVILPTMTFGDAVFLPWFNYRAFLAVTAARKAGLRFGKMEAWYLFITTLVSVVLNSVASYSWCHDQFTGATDTVYGHLTVLGWWHYGFSIIQMEIIFAVLGVWYSTIRNNNQTTQLLFERAWHVLMAFSLFPVFDALLKSIFVYKGLSIWQVVSLEKMTVLPIILSVLAFLVLQRIQRRRVKARELMKGSVLEK